jgi:hypothetical protein
MLGGVGTEYRTVLRYDPATRAEIAEWQRWHEHPIRGELVVLVEQDTSGNEQRSWPRETDAPYFRKWPAGTQLQY